MIIPQYSYFALKRTLNLQEILTNLLAYLFPQNVQSNEEFLLNGFDLNSTATIFRASYWYFPGQNSHLKNSTFLIKINAKIFFKAVKTIEVTARILLA